MNEAALAEQDDTEMLQAWLDEYGELPPLEPRIYHISRPLRLPLLNGVDDAGRTR